jgi:hypothetical protein
MALTCPNGHANDEGNRFCEQCGAPLQQPQASVAPPVAQTSASADTTSSTCPVCGQENMPGTAFCDNCGAALPPPMPAASQEAAVSAPAEAVIATAAGSSTTAATIACPQCGTENDASNRFCDNCGARLGDADAAAQAAETSGSGSNARIIDVPETAAPEAPPIDATIAPPPAEAATSQAAPAAIDTVAPAPEAPPAAATSGGSADRQRLEEEIRTQQQVIGQMEQMQANFGAATPAAIVQGLDEARRKLAQAEADLQNLTGGSD